MVDLKKVRIDQCKSSKLVCLQVIFNIYIGELCNDSCMFIYTLVDD